VTEEGGGEKRGRKVRIDLRKNRGKPARRKSGWTRQVRAGDERVEEATQFEAVRAKGDLSRRRTVIIGDEPAQRSLWRDGVVVAVRGLVSEVDDGGGRWACTVRRMLRTRLISERVPITVGDVVRFAPVEQGGEPARVVSEGEALPEGVIEEVSPRKTVMTRQYERKVQVVAANVDQVVIVVAADRPTLRPHLVDRYLVMVHKGDMRPLVCINKVDLDGDGVAAEVSARYAGLGYRSLLTSVVDGRGIEELRGALQGQTSVVVGPSGAGKSSLLNALEPGLALKIGTLTDLERGRHTTTTARLLRWSFGGYVVDTPGMRQFELSGVEADELEAYFREFVGLIPQCRFPGCSHTHEVGCAVKEAVEAGGISGERYESYCKMYEECASRRKY
jgi:ribosome biogenesis GTPase